MRRNLAVVLAVAVAGVATTGGCAREIDDDDRVFRGEPPPMPSDAEIEDLFDRSIDTMVDDVDAAEITTQLDLRPSQGLGSVHIALEGAFDVEGRTDVSFSIEAPMGTPPYRMVSDGETVWVRVDDPERAAELPDGASWIEASMSEMRSEGLVQDPSNTWQMLPYLRGARTWEDGGVTQAHGQLVRVIRGTIDDEEAKSEASPAEKAGLDITFSLGRVDSFTYEVWLDDEGRVWGVDLDPVSEQRQGVVLRGHLEMRVQSFDQPVEVDEPAKDEIVLAEDLPEGLDILRP